MDSTIFAPKKVLVAGAGTMGQGIAQWFLQQEQEVGLFDPMEGALDRAEKQLTSTFSKLKEKGKITPEQEQFYLQRLKLVSDVEKSRAFIADADLIIEAIIEDPTVKGKLFGTVAPLASKKGVVIATNTSGLSVTSLAKNFLPGMRERFLGIHFFNPAPLMPLVELVRTPWSDPALLQAVTEWFRHRGKVPAQCQDRPGFIVNRVNRNFYGEPLRIVNGMDQTHFREVDAIMREVGGFKMGPFELMDLIGIDINYAVTVNQWKSFFHEPRFAPHWLQEHLVEGGKLGKKTGEGFYKYEGK